MRRKSSKALLGLSIGEFSYRDFSYLIFSFLLVLQMTATTSNQLEIRVHYSERSYVYANFAVDALTREASYYEFSNLDYFLMTTSFDYKKRYQSKSLETAIINILPKTFQGRAQFYVKPLLDMSLKHNMDPLWVASLIWAESHFNISSSSSVGAQGLMQIMPATHNYLVSKYKLSKSYKHYQVQIPFQVSYYEDSLHNLELGVLYLKKLLKRFKSPKLATIAYNMGPTWTSRRLRNKKPVGNKNIYLSKVKRAYKYISKRL